MSVAWSDDDDDDRDYDATPTSSPDPSTSSPSSTDPTLEDLQIRCTTLLSELTLFSTHLATQRRQNAVELRALRGAVQAEQKSLRRLAAATAPAERRSHAARSSNVPFYETVWETAKGSRGVVAFSKRFYWEARAPRKPRGDGANGTDAAHTGPPFGVATKPKRNSALVDIVAEDGLEWIKVSTISETRLLFEIAKQGWELHGSSDDSSSSPDGDSASHASRHSDADTDEIPILRMAEDLSRASRATRIRYRHPRVIIVLPKIQPGRISAIDQILADMSRTGAHLRTASPSLPSPHPPLPLPTALTNMTSTPQTRLTPILNIDCTILLALVSDLSHARVEAAPWFHCATRRQIEAEEQENLLPAALYPVLRGRGLVCTVEAARRCREIVDTIGTETERERAGLLFGEAAEGEGAGEALRAGFARLSEYEVPEDWMLPVEVVPRGEGVEGLPRLAEGVRECLTAINQSVFLYGWRSGRTTVTSNRTVYKVIEAAVEQHRRADEEDVLGPDMWLCPTARSLVGKEKHRK